MTTKKITLNELRSIIRQALKEETILQEANLEVKSIAKKLYLPKKSPSPLIQSTIAVGETDFENKNLINKFLFESMLESGLSLDGLIKENVTDINEGRELLNESIVGTIGIALATGKLLDVIGVLFKKIYNWMIKKGWIKGKEIEKTKLEELGEWIHTNVIMGIFKVIATTLLGVIAAFVGAVNVFNGGNGEIINQIVSEDNIKKLAATLFYVTIFMVGAQGFMAVADSIVHGSHIIHGIVETVASGTKLYELILLILAFYSATYIDAYKPFKNRIPDLAHAYGECLEGDKNIYNAIKAQVKSIKSGNTKQIDCVNHHLNIHRNNHGSANQAH